MRYVGNVGADRETMEEPQLEILDLKSIIYEQVCQYILLI